MKNRIIIGTTGTFASGKNEINNYLVEKYEFVNFTCSDEVREELKERGLLDDRDNLTKVANEMREEGGNGIIGKRIVRKINERHLARVTIDGIRHPDEVAVFRESGSFYLIKVDAPVEVRYNRVKSRGTLKDEITLEKFKEQESYEMKNNDQNSQQILATMELADYSIINDGSLEELYSKIELILKEIGFHEN